MVCGAYYKERIADFVQISGARTTFLPPSFLPKWYYEMPIARNARMLAGELEWSPDVLGWEDEWVERSFGAAHTQILACWASGGRFWQTDLFLQAYLEEFSLNSTSLRILLSSRLRLQVFGSANALLPAVLQNSFCAPADCNTVEVVRVEVLPNYLTQMLNIPYALPPPVAGLIDAHELVPWSELSLDFVIAGVDSCGTTSMLRNLAQHPWIGFTQRDEDGFLATGMQHKLLPARLDIESFNSQWQNGGARPKILGLLNPLIFTSSLARHALALLPELRMILVLCDPLRRIEDRFYQFYYCNSTYVNSSKAHIGMELCDWSISGALRMSQRLLAPDLKSMVDMFGSRLLVLHQEWLQLDPRGAYSRIAAFLGANDFPSGTEFYRYNCHRAAHVTDLCSNQTLVRKLQQLLASDYAYMEDLLNLYGHVPDSLKLRKTRCDQQHKRESNSELKCHTR